MRRRRTPTATASCFFRHSEVIAAGNLLSSISYPLIDTDKGGTIQGVIDGLNQILDVAVPEYRGQGGTWIVPGRGRLSDTADVASYRNMLVIIRDRIADLKKKGMTLDQVKAAHPTLDFDGRYGSTTGRGPRTCSFRRCFGLCRRRSKCATSSGFSRWPSCMTAVTTAFAHHSFGATYDTSKQMKIEGKLVQFVYRNPHSFVHVEAPDADGVVQRWAVEWGGTSQLAGAGVKRDSLKIGDDGRDRRPAVARAGRVSGC